MSIETAHGILGRSKSGRMSHAWQSKDLFTKGSSVLEVNVGLICACSLAFPAFIDRYKGPLATRLRSYMSFMRTTTSSHTPKNAERSGPCIQAPASATYKKGLVLNESYSKLSGDSGGYPMSDFTSSEAVDSSQHMTRRADIEYKGGDQLVYPEEAYSPRQGV
ncbi:MAG: hypothetical protein L6R38_008320 [Xanthoria sp. 2 TBL-2021]|nr:MAG: hypothetical protein L6R38_008320 [Xanthoria sp. 2 TBL-2021]